METDTRIIFGSQLRQDYWDVPMPSRKVTDVRVIDSTGNVDTIQVTCDDATVFTGYCNRGGGTVTWDSPQSDSLDDPLVSAMETQRWITRIERKHLP